MPLSSNFDFTHLIIGNSISLECIFELHCFVHMVYILLNALPDVNGVICCTALSECFDMWSPDTCTMHVKPVPHIEDMLAVRYHMDQYRVPQMKAGIFLLFTLLFDYFTFREYWASSTGLTAVSKFKPRLPAQWSVGTHRKGPSQMEKVTSRMNWPIRNSTQIRIRI